MDKTIDRIKAYENAGADIIFPEALKNEKEFEKVRKYSKKYLVHYEGKETIKIGDKVQIMSCRPISKNKSWRLERVLKG